MASTSLFAKSLMSNVARVKEEHASRPQLVHGGVHGRTLHKTCLEKENKIPNLKDGIEVIFPSTKDELKSLLLSSSGGKTEVDISDIIISMTPLDKHTLAKGLLTSALNITVDINVLTDFLWSVRIDHIN